MTGYIFQDTMERETTNRDMEVLMQKGFVILQPLKLSLNTLYNGNCFLPHQKCSGYGLRDCVMEFYSWELDICGSCLSFCDFSLKHSLCLYSLLFLPYKIFCCFLMQQYMLVKMDFCSYGNFELFT